MFKSFHHRIYYILIGFCLVLLFSFLAYWNYNQYSEQVSGIEKNFQLSFENVVREVEDGLWQTKVLGNLTRVSLKKSNVQTVISELRDSVAQDHRHDMKMFVGVIDTMLENVSAKAESFIQLRTKVDTAFEFRTNANVYTLIEEDTNAVNLPKDFSGMLSLHVVASNDTDDSVKVKMVDSLMFNVVKARLNKAGSPEFDIVKMTKVQDTVGSGILYAGKYTDLVTGDSYIGKVAGYRWAVIKGMWPQIGFSIFLFSITVLAFYYVVKSLIEQKKLAELKNDFISNMTHELKTPITTVGVALEALSSFNALQDPKRTDEYIDISQKELKRLSLLVDKVLKMALFEKKEPELKLEQIDLKLLLKEVLTSMKLHFDKYGAEHSLTIDGVNFVMEGDRVHLTSVVYNLIDNALKYSPDHPKVSISLQNHTDELLLMVEDNGVGIDKAYKDKIFEKFFRVPSGDQHNSKGYGLGLSYVASVVHKHQGDISFSSELGKGTVFTIKLPRYHE